MCKKLTSVIKNKCGEIYYCNDCKTHHILFNNFHFILNQKQLKSLKKSINSIDISYWEAQFECTTIKRKIPIPTCQENLILIFNKHEFNAFKELIFNNEYDIKLLKIEDIDYNYILN